MIKLKLLLLEIYKQFSGKTILVVDIQEEYQKGFGFRMYDFAQFINMNAKDNRIVICYNGSEMGGPSESELIEWYIDNGINEDILINEINFIEKEHGYFRSLMDNSGDFDDIVKLGKLMWNNEYYNTEDISNDEWVNLNIPVIKDMVDSGEKIWPPFDLMRDLNNLSNIILVGGDKYECLAEIEIMLDILEKDYTKYEPFIYG